MKDIKKAMAVTIVTGGLVIAGAGVAAAHGTQADGKAANSPGVGSGNPVQVPVHVPVNATGDTANVIGALNPAFADESNNG
ncbi:chaplin [Streptomyces sp. MST-110588]|uniref:chaplin n=1 Tax=Streptomyces sp. MST-110588 TaxID=2833628 RepID=UPI001F5E270B|nr:chaplin [Streptomyces sp. MST-110588]UNO42822.1 chaplin [Streptomyces sp. MST-110588]